MVKRSNTAIVIDDNRVALNISTRLVQSVAKDLNVVSLNSGKALIEYLEKTDEIPSVVFSDLNMEGLNGKDLLSWCKRHPKFHILPFIFLSAEALKEDMVKLGALDYCLKPLQVEAISTAFEKAKSKFMCFNSEDDIDLSFADETLELCQRLKQILNSTLGEKEINEIYRIFHTIKGVAASLDYSYLASFVHQAENFLTIIKNKKSYTSAVIKQVLNLTEQYLVQSIQQLKNQQQMPEASTELLKSLNSAHEILENQSPSEKTVVMNASDNVIEFNTKSDTLRVKHKSLDDIQLQLKKILQLKVQMNHFSRQLQEEFFDESFPKDLAQMITKLEQSSLAALESLILLRVQPVDVLSPYCTKLVQELSQKLAKKCEIVFSKNGELEVDTPIIELLKAAFTHTFRNALDHGIELPNKRLEAGKPEIGKIHVHYQKLENKTFKVEIKDDGNGINREKLQAALISKQILSEEQVKGLNDHQLNQMIFVDGLSTKTEVTDISGRGVGISAVKDDIEKMNGSLVVESMEGKGTTFIITLPLYFVL